MHTAQYAASMRSRIQEASRYAASKHRVLSTYCGYILTTAMRSCHPFRRLCAAPAPQFLLVELTLFGNPDVSPSRRGGCHAQTVAMLFVSLEYFFY